MHVVATDGQQKQVILAYIAHKTGCRNLDPAMTVAFAIISSTGHVVGGVVISNFRETDCEIAVAAETPMAWRTPVCRAVFEYIFRTAGCVRVTAITVKSHKRSRAFLEHFGFELEGKIRRGYDGRRDALIYGLLAEDCRYLGDQAGGLNGEEIGAKAAACA